MTSPTVVPPADPAGGAAPAPEVVSVCPGQDVGEWASAGGYRLSMRDGFTLALTNPNGEVVGEWAPDPDSRFPIETVAFAIDGEGNLQVEHAGDPRIDAGDNIRITEFEERPDGTVVATDPADLTRVASFELGADGNLVAVDSKSRRHRIFDPVAAANRATMDVQHGRFEILHLQPEPLKLKEFIELSQAAINNLIDYAAIGIPGKIPPTAPSVEPQLVEATQIASAAEWNSASRQAYEGLAERMNALTDDLARRDVEVRDIVAQVPGKTELAAADIENRIWWLNTLLAFRAMAAGISADPDNDKLAIQQVSEAVHYVQNRVHTLWIELDQASKGIVDPPVPPDSPSSDPDTPPSGGSDAAPPAPGVNPPPGDSGTPNATTLQSAPGSGAGIGSGLTGGVPGLQDVGGADSAGSGVGADESVADLIQAAANQGNPAGVGAAGNPMNNLAAAAMPLAMVAAQFAPVIGKMVSDGMAQQQRQQDLDRDRQEREAVDHSPPPEQPVSPPAAPPPAAPDGVQPPAASTTPPPTAPTDPPVVPRNVDLPLDGHNYRVPEVVAGAAHTALSNPNGSDAVAAFNGTAGDPESWRPIPASEQQEVQSGDVAKWEERTALVLKDDQGLQMIVNGQLVPLSDPNLPPDDGHGPYGNFVHFLRPEGTDMAPENAVPTDPQQATAVPAVPPVPEVTTARR
ncbi:hypothetical protein [Nocardia brasiliensis]